MDRRIGSALGLVGGLLAAVGVFLPWFTGGVNLAPLRDALGALASVAENYIGTFSLSLSGFDFLTGGQQFQSLTQIGPPGGSAPDLGPVALFLKIMGALAALVLLFAVLSIVFSALNLAKGRLRGGMIGAGAALLVFSILSFGLLRMVITTAYSALQQQAASLGGQAAAGLNVDIGQLLSQVLQISIGTGLYLCLAGGILAVAGGVMGRKREKAVPAEAPPAPVAAPAAAEGAK